jgi:hypothetical protein
MLTETDFITKFIDLQIETLRASKSVVDMVGTGILETELAEAFDAELSKYKLPLSKWYPTLICAGEYSGQPLTRRNHLPSANVILRENDIVILDITPQHETVWGNWSVTIAIGNDPFYQELVKDIFEVTVQTAMFSATDAATIGEIYDHCQKLAADKKLISIDPRDDVGHNIFQVPANQTVDKTPEQDRVFLDGAGYRNAPLTGLISIEPQLSRINPADGKQYGAKHQFIVPFLAPSLKSEAEALISMQLKFYNDIGFLFNAIAIPVPTKSKLN